MVDSPAMRRLSDSELIRRFVTAFPKLGDTARYRSEAGGGPLPPEMDGGTDDSPWAVQRWRPGEIRTDPAALREVYDNLPGPFPPLFEHLVLNYRWLEIDLDGFVTLLANPPGPALGPLLSGIRSDATLVEVVLPVGLVPFGKASGGSYDPVCFDTRRRRPDGDCPVVRVEHEAVLCDRRIGQSWELADSFRSLVVAAISKSTAI